MRRFVNRLCLRTVTAVTASFPLLLAGCDKLQPAGGNPTMTLLRDGSEKVCIAADIQQALRDLIVPKAADVWPDTPLETRVAGAKGVSLGYTLTTLQSFDKAVAKAVCDSNVTIRGATDDKTNNFRIDYQVSPSADNTNTFVVTADIDAAHAFAKELIGDAVDAAADDIAEAESDREEERQKQKLLATISEKWLVGAWIDATADQAQCGNGSAIWLEANHVLEGGRGKGRWALSGDQLHLVAAQGFDATGTITQADAISFQMTLTEGGSWSLRRCTRDETEALPQPTNYGSAEQ